MFQKWVNFQDTVAWYEKGFTWLGIQDRGFQSKNCKNSSFWDIFDTGIGNKTE